MSIVSELKEAKTHINTAIAMIESGSPVEPSILQWDTETYDKLSWPEVLAVLEMRKVWRVPTYQELVSIVEPSNAPTVIDDLVPIIKPKFYWTSTRFNDHKVYDVSFRHGCSSTARIIPKLGRSPQTCDLILVK